jgi:hypothetical protein
MFTASGNFALRTIAPPTRGREDAVESLIGSKDELDNGEMLQAKFRRLFGCKRGLIGRNLMAGTFDGIPYTRPGRSSNDIVAVERGCQRNGFEEVWTKLLAKTLQLLQRELVQLASCLQT